MLRKRIFVMPMFVAILVSCASDSEPTIFPMPAGASDVMWTVLSNGSGHQTNFILHVNYPSIAALEHYSKVIGQPWRYCTWGGKDWSSFIDTAGEKPRTNHQQLHMWVNPKAKRTLALALLYYSEPSRQGDPDNDSQTVVLIERMSTDIKETIDQLKLSCPPDVHAAL